MDGDDEQPSNGSLDDRENTSNWVSVPGRVRRHETDSEDDLQSKRPKSAHVQVPNIPVSNQYQTLNDISDQEMHPSAPKTSGINDNSQNNREKVPLITVMNVSIQNLIKEVKKSLSKTVNDNIHYNLTRFGIRMRIQTTKHFKVVREWLRTSNMHFYSHPLDEEKATKFVLYGLHDMDLEELTDIFASHDVFPTSISKMKINKKRYDDQNIYLLQFVNDKNICLEKLRTIRHINYVSVKFERYMRDRNGLTQCSRCLRFSHGARNCNLPARCIRCGENHLSADCDKLMRKNDPMSKIPQDKIKCANCNGHHTANYEKCPERQKYLATRQKNHSSVRNKIQGHAQR